MRDKLLGVSGKEDIDIALDNMAGNDFAIALNKWHISNGIEIALAGLRVNSNDIAIIYLNEYEVLHIRSVLHVFLFVISSFIILNYTE